MCIYEQNCVYLSMMHIRNHRFQPFSYVYQCAVKRLFINDYPLIRKSAISRVMICPGVAIARLNCRTNRNPAALLVIRFAPVDLESAVTLLKQNQPCHLVCERHRRQADSRVRPSDYLRCYAVVTAGLKSPNMQRSK